MRIAIKILDLNEEEEDEGTLILELFWPFEDDNSIFNITLFFFFYIRKLVILLHLTFDILFYHFCSDATSVQIAT